MHKQTKKKYTALENDTACVGFAEFPTTLEAAQATSDAGIQVMMGAPNVLRGGSHSGNVAAMDLVEAGCMDILSSDYAPISLMHAVFALNEKVGIALPNALATVTRNPATMLGHDDRGVIATGKRADILRVRRLECAPVIAGVWTEGERQA